MKIAGYRRDIDGLRALAIVPVVLFHAGIPGFSGGFVGVDIFFVISGYLITGILLSDVQRERFSILGFYDRRIRRIFPALITMLLITLALGLVVLLPSELTELARSSISSVLFSSNILFWSKVNYFGPAPFEMPLLHTWSLAVEEQFYILWPLAIAVVGAPRWRRFLLPLTLAAFVASFAMAIFLMGVSSRSAFYMFPPRAWELLAGALLAIAPGFTIPSRPLRQAASVLGAALILWSVFTYTIDTKFPGLAAVLPVGGTALMLLANDRQDTWVAKILGLPLLVGIGLISYSLYLWHWPLIAIERLTSTTPVTPLISAGIVAASFLAGYLSWRFVEAPFRKVSHDSTLRVREQKRVITAGLAAIVVVLAASGGLLLAHGFPQRLPVAAQLVDKYPVQPFKPAIGCSYMGIKRGASISHCFTDDPRAQQATVLLWGDSHAQAFSPGLTEAGAREKQLVLTTSLTSCVPLPGTATARRAAQYKVSAARQPCVHFNDEVLQNLLRMPKLKTVVLVARWNTFTPGPDQEQREDAGVSRFLIDPQSNAMTYPATMQVLKRSLDGLAGRLQAAGKRMILVAQVPDIRSSPLKCVIRTRWRGQSDEICKPYLSEILERRQPISQVLAAVAAGHANVTLVDPLPAFCRAGRCDVSEASAPLFRDASHVTLAGSRRAANTIPAALLR